MRSSCPEVGEPPRAPAWPRLRRRDCAGWPSWAAAPSRDGSAADRADSAWAEAGAEAAGRDDSGAEAGADEGPEEDGADAADGADGLEEPPERTAVMASTSWLLRIAPAPLMPSPPAICFSSGSSIPARPEARRREPAAGASAVLVEESVT